MTPTVQAILNDSTLPKSKRQFNDSCKVIPDLLSSHCFECTAVVGLARDMSKRFATTGTSERLGFLPSPITVLDFRSRWHAKMRSAIVLKEGPADTFSASMIGLSPLEMFSMPIGSVPRVLEAHRSAHPDARKRAEYLADFEDSSEFILALLAIINTPRIIGRRQHMPHAGLQRKLSSALGMVGKYPLHAWHEVLLEVTPPKIDEDGIRETRLSGQRALHFCRAHLRVRLGMLELVSAHWRGDAALGIKQTRYSLQRH